MPKVRAKTIWVDRWEKTPARTAQDKIKRRTPAGSSLAGVLLFCTNLTQPTGALDSKSSKMLLEKISYLNIKNMATILMVTHDAFTASYASRVIFIKDGRIFNELLREGRNRKEFFDDIMDVVTMLGGELNDAF